MQWPWITRSHHREVVDLLEQQVRDLRAQRDVMLDENRALSQRAFALFEGARPAQAREAQRPHKLTTPESKPAPLDPDDNAALLRQAMRETGSRNASTVMRWVERLRRQALRKRDQMPIMTAGQEPASSEESRLAAVQRLIDSTLASAEQDAHTQVTLGAI